MWTRPDQALMEEYMRLNFTNIDQPKRIAKRLASATTKPLTKCHEALASAVGYRNWHDLEQLIGRNKNESPLHNLSIVEHADLIVTIANCLDAEAGDVQFALCDSGVNDEDQKGLMFQQDLRGLVFRKTSIPDQGRRQPGSVGKLKYNSIPLILKSFGDLTHAVGESGSGYALADFEFVTPRREIPLFIPARLYLAYGAWQEADGALVLHSRDYLPMWRVRPDRCPERLNPADWIVHDDDKDQWFWEDLSAPWDSEKRRQEEIARLESFGIRGMPLLVEVLPDMIFDGRAAKPKDAAMLRFRPTSNRPYLNHDMRKLSTDLPEIAQ
jgi:hypothetical protein